MKKPKGLLAWTGVGCGGLLALMLIIGSIGIGLEERAAREKDAVDEDETRIAEGSSRTRLSQLAENLSTGMDQPAVIQLLGPAHWAILPGDGGELALLDSLILLELRWDNPACTPVVVDFDLGGKVSGWDGGVVCGADWYELSKPGDEYLCGLPDRAKYCK